MTSIAFTVHGTPAPQGSKRHVGNGVMIESSKRVKPWREAVKHAALDAMGDDWQQITGPVHLIVAFYRQRPKGHYGTGRNADKVKESAPTWKATAPDLSKLIRSTEDAITDAGLWRDDSLVASITASDSWAEVSGAWVCITEIEPL